MATWTPFNSAEGATASSTATVTVLPPPQLAFQLNPNLIQASGASQMSGSIQNGAVVGQLLPSLNSADPTGNIQSRSGLNVPVVCAGSNTNCQ
jgi:hypothetical protein